MSMSPHEETIGASKLTYDDYVTLPDDGKRYEILDGDLAVTPSPTTKHQIVSANLGNLLYNHVREHGLGRVLQAPMDAILDAHTVVEPDILFIATARSHIIEAHAIVGPPDLVVEILSPTTSHRDKGVKTRLYARFGVEHYWLVDSVERTLETFHLHGASGPSAVYGAREFYAGDVPMTPAVFPTLTIELARVWE